MIFCALRKRGLQFVQLSLKGVSSFHGIVWCKKLTEVHSKIPVSFSIESDKKLSCIRSCITPQVT